MAIPSVSSLFSSTVLASSKPFVVYFSAGWCGPCKAFAPILEKVAEDYADTVSFGKVDVDEAPQLAAKYGVRSIPTMLLFKGGKPVGQLSNAVPREKLEAFIASGA